MQFRFPSLSALQIALTTGLIPDEAVRKQAQFAVQPDGKVVVQSETEISAECDYKLRRLLVGCGKKHSEVLSESVTCWPQLLPLEPAEPIASLEKLTVLFDVGDDTSIADFISEILRQGNDRISFQQVEEWGTQRTLVRVVGPPYYSLLRAIERPTGTEPLAFTEQGAGVWVAFGWRHPLAARLRPPTGKTLFLAPPRNWKLRVLGRFTDLNEVAEFTLPEPTSEPVLAGEVPRFQVPLRLVAGDAAEPAEFWILKGEASSQVDDLVQHADDRLLSRLAFAVAEREGETLTVLRVRPGEGAPPVVVLDAVAYRPYLKLSNLFVPVGQRISPPLRRATLQRLLAPDLSQIVWLEPTGQGNFAPQVLADRAFRPIGDWVDYVMDRDHVALTGWMQSLRFEFDQFVIRETDADRRERRARESSDSQERERVENAAAADEASAVSPLKSKGRRKQSAPRAPAADYTPVSLPPTEQRLRANELQAALSAITSPLDLTPEQHDHWRELSGLLASLGQAADAGLCGTTYLWQNPSAPPPGFWVWWRRDISVPPEVEWTEAWLRELLAVPKPTAVQIQSLAACLMHSLTDTTNRKLLTMHLGEIQRYLEAGDSSLPVRAEWLAWWACYQLSSRDVLMLARARDRLLERLFRTGLTSDLDLPSFLRFSGGAANERFRAARESLTSVHQMVERWLEPQSTTETRAYVSCMFAWAYGRVGDVAESVRWQSLAHEQLKTALANNQTRHIHHWLVDAFDFRIEQVRQGVAGGPLSDDLLSRLAAFENKNERMVADRLRELSRIIEPHDRIYSYGRWFTEQKDEHKRALSAVLREQDRELQLTAARQLIDKAAEQTYGPIGQAEIVRTILRIAPGLGYDFGVSLLPHVEATLNRDLPVDESARLLEAALYVAAHFDQTEYVELLLDRFRALLALKQPGSELAVGLALQQCLTGLRKVGLRMQMLELLEEMTTLAGKLAKKATKPGVSDFRSVGFQRLNLGTAAGWFHFGQDQKAEQILSGVPAVIPELDHATHVRDVVLAYLQALQQAPLPVVVARIQQILDAAPHCHVIQTLTDSYYWISHLQLAEGVILALMTEDISLDRAGRRWLDDDELTVRRRIHADMKQALGTGL